MTESYIQQDSNGKGVAFVGEDAVNLFRAASLRSALNLYASCKIIPTRGMTISRMLTMATEYTGKKYKRNGAVQAAKDVHTWVLAMKAALPVKKD